jgi:UDP-N-acetylmuramoyl-tripeptide--D-alanyl-D-alanine ligase
MSPQAQDSWLLVLAVGACVLAGLRWLRVAQREHYLPGAALVFARRWWGSGGLNRVLWAAGLAGATVSLWYPRAALGAVVVAGAAPIGLSLRGRTGKLAWTRRLRLLAFLSVLLAAAVVGAVAALGLRPALSAAAFCGVGSPVVVDVALLLARPIEARLLRTYVDKARQRLAVVSPRVVAITGSYGKTTTKGYIAHLAGGSMSVVASPASFNNTAGLARAVNEHLATGTVLFVAEMGTYGPGEIASMCEWVPPDIAVITAIGPVHLERMGSIERIAEAKAEVLQKARTVVLNVDHPLLAELAQKAEDEGKTVWRCSGAGPAGAGADVVVSVEDAKLRVRATHFKVELDLLVASAPGVAPGNVACAVAAALSLGVPHEKVASRLESLPVAPHRRSTGQTANDVSVIDDTFNANPAGARAALEQLGATGAREGKRVVVTPGMVELGHVQQRENANFAAAAGAVADLLVVVGRTNARALLAGARAAGLAARRARHREDAVAWVSANLGPGDAVLYENDLPDHYP